MCFFGVSAKVSSISSCGRAVFTMHLEHMEHLYGVLSSCFGVEV